MWSPVVEIFTRRVLPVGKVLAADLDVTSCAWADSRFDAQQVCRVRSGVGLPGRPRGRALTGSRVSESVFLSALVSPSFLSLSLRPSRVLSSSDGCVFYLEGHIVKRSASWRAGINTCRPGKGVKRGSAECAREQTSPLSGTHGFSLCDSQGPVNDTGFLFHFGLFSFMISTRPILGGRRFYFKIFSNKIIF